MQETVVVPVLATMVSMRLSGTNPWLGLLAPNLFISIKKFFKIYFLKFHLKFEYNFKLRVYIHLVINE